MITRQRKAQNGDGRLVFIIYSTFTEKPGGRETWITHVASGMKTRGYHTSVICCQPRQAPQSNSPTDLELIRTKTPRSVIPGFLFWAKISLGLLLILDAVWFIIQSNRIAGEVLNKGGDRIHFIAMNTVIEGAVVYYIQKKLGHRRVIVSARGKSPLEIAQTLPYLKPLVFLMEKKVVESIKNIWANGYDTAEYLKKIGAQPTVIPNGVDYAAYSTPLRPSFAEASEGSEGQEQQQLTTNKPLTVMSIATLRPIKGIPQLTEAIPEIARLTNQLFKVVFVGAGNPKPYRSYLQKRGLEHLADFCGPVLAIEIIHKADIVTCLSGGSGMSMSTLEAMAAGKAIVAWNSPVYRQMLKHNFNALLVPKGDVNALAKAIVNLVENPKLRKSLGKNAQKAAKIYDWGKVCEKIDTALKSIG